jgi:hypothetical protein
LRITDPDKIEKIFLGNVPLLREGRASGEDEQANDEARMTNNEGMTKPKNRSARSRRFVHLIIRYCFELRHSAFVIA